MRRLLQLVFAALIVGCGADVRRAGEGSQCGGSPIYPAQCAAGLTCCPPDPQGDVPGICVRVDALLGEGARCWDASGRCCALDLVCAPTTSELERVCVRP